MEKKIHSAKYAKQRRFLLILPMLILPFLTLMFWAFGGGNGAALAQSKTQQGLNLKLPDAKLKDEKELNKLSFYQQAALDSAKTKEAEKLDPYWNKSFTDSGFDNRYKAGLSNTGMDANQMKVYNKLDELKMALSRSQEASGMNSKSNYSHYSLKSYSSSNDVERLQSMMQKMNADKTEDPEITQLNEMLDKIQAIQNPEQASNNSKNVSLNKTLSVKTKKQKASISLLKPDATPKVSIDTFIQAETPNGFYSDAAFKSNDDSTDNNAIEATIPETQTVVAGSTVKLILTSNVTISDMMLPAGTFVYGTASLSNERLKIAISSIRYQNSILPVSLDVYDMDGQQGIYVPGSINRTVAKESANNAVGGIDATTIDPSIGGQAASAGIEAAKTLFTKKVKLIKLTIRAGYKVFLRDNHDK